MNRKNKERVCLALGFVQAEDAISKIINNNYNDKYEIVQNVRSKEALYETIMNEKYEKIILREDLSGNLDLIELFKTIRINNKDAQILLFINNRQNGDPFFMELFLFNIYDFVIMPNIKLDEVFGLLETPRIFNDIVKYLPTRPERVRNLIIEANKDLKSPLKVDKEGDIDEVLDINISKETDKKPVEVKEIVREVIKYVEKPVEVIREVPVYIKEDINLPASQKIETPVTTKVESSIKDIKVIEKDNIELKTLEEELNDIQAKNSQTDNEYIAIVDEAEEDDI